MMVITVNGVDKYKQFCDTIDVDNKQCWCMILVLLTL